MKSVQELCTPRKSIFDQGNREDTLNLSELIQQKINPLHFFEENFLTNGMKILLNTAFERFEKKSNVSVIKLTQAMGGGKTHNMISLGLLAQNPELRQSLQKSGLNLTYTGKVRVAAFSGRESDEPFGIWGAIAKQLGKQELFKDYYQPLRAPGETAWINLLQGDPLLILLDELPPYFKNAATISIGNSDLSVATTTALSNLLVAVNKEELSNVLVVISDLKASYESGSERLNESLRDLEKEIGRSALNLEPVQLNSDEVYHILRKKIFESTPTEKEIQSVAEAYSKEIAKAKQMELILSSPEEFLIQIKSSYPFHPAIKDLYARFKENSGFQQTRGLIRLLRSVVANIYTNKKNNYLISPQHVDLNDSAIYNFVSTINSTLVPAISHDIAAKGNAIAEQLDSPKKTTEYQDAVKVIFFSCLSDVPNGIKGLTEGELIAYLCEPGRDITTIKQTILPSLKTNCWYLHIDREGKYLFKNTENLVAKISAYIQSYDGTASRHEIQDILKKLFQSHTDDVYQRLEVLKSLDELQLVMDKVTLFIAEPESGSGIPKKILDFYNNQTYKNRILFLTGERSGMDSLVSQAKNVKAIKKIIEEMNTAKISPNEEQYKEAKNLEETYLHQFYSAARETFTKLFYPTKEKLFEADFSMKFPSNSYRGEDQIRETLVAKKKFELNTENDIFRQKCEQRLFTNQQMEWSEIKKRSAMSPEWQFHKLDALDKLKERMKRQQRWRGEEEGGKYLDKGPFPLPKTSVRITSTRNEQTGVATLRLTPNNGDTIYYDFKSNPTKASQTVGDHSRFETSEIRVKFLCVDSTGNHEEGEVVEWKNSLEVKYKSIQNPNSGVVVELKSIPDAEIRYSTDGSNPKEFGGIYAGPITITQKCILQFYSYKDGIESILYLQEIDPKEKNIIHINPIKPLLWKNRFVKTETNQVYEWLEKLRKYRILVGGCRLNSYSDPSDDDVWTDLSLGNKLFLESGKIATLFDSLREIVLRNGSKISLEFETWKFESGKEFTDFIVSENLEYKPEDIVQ